MAKQVALLINIIHISIYSFSPILLISFFSSASILVTPTGLRATALTILVNCEWIRSRGVQHFEWVALLCVYALTNQWGYYRFLCWPFPLLNPKYVPVCFELSLGKYTKYSGLMNGSHFVRVNRDLAPVLRWILISSRGDDILNVSVVRINQTKTQKTYVFWKNLRIRQFGLERVSHVAIGRQILRSRLIFMVTQDWSIVRNLFIIVIKVQT